MRGPINVSSPDPVKNVELMTELGSAVGRQGMFSIPPFALNLVLGEMGSVTLASQRVVPRAVMAAGFKFAYPQLRPALDSLVS
jgi:hypothetical protein